MRHSCELPMQCIAFFLLFSFTQPIMPAGTSLKKGGESAAAAVLETMSAIQMQHLTDATAANIGEQADSQAQTLQAISSSAAYSQQNTQKQLESEEAQFRVQQQALLLKQQELAYPLFMKSQHEHLQKCLNAKTGTEMLMTMLSGHLPPDLRASVLKEQATVQHCGNRLPIRLCAGYLSILTIHSVCYPRPCRL
jgi:hypothetical protein